MHHAPPLGQAVGGSASKVDKGRWSRPLGTNAKAVADKQEPLRGLRLVVTGLDLEQAEHRGIAMYSKALLRALQLSGAELWLLSEFEPREHDHSIRATPLAVRKLVFAAKLLDALSGGSRAHPLPLEGTRLTRKTRWAQGLIRRCAKTLALISNALFRKTYKLSAARRVSTYELYDNPYTRLERLDYLDDLSGILCAKNIYRRSLGRAYTNRRIPIRVQLDDFDALVTTCPLHLCTDSNKALIQTIHDLIPLEFARTTDHPGIFAHRLEACKQSQRLFVSTSTKVKYELAFGADNPEQSAVVIQPPSLQIPSVHKRKMIQQDTFRPSRRAKQRHGELKAFSYILFNSSVEPRKNLLFIIKAYRQSGLGDLGIRLCVTGQLKNDDYSRDVAEQADESILLTGYIDETTKSALYLNSLMVLSPSLVEGFGIPVLDAACIGSPVIASPSGSHIEIQKLHDFHDLVWLCDTRDPVEWALAMRELAEFQKQQITSTQSERNRRLERYDDVSKIVFEDFRTTVCQQVIHCIEATRKG